MKVTVFGYRTALFGPAVRPAVLARVIVVDEDKPLRIKPWLLFFRTIRCGADVRPVLLGGRRLS
jgi:hypothetical protein